MGGAIHLPDEARRFLAIVARQTERIIAIVEDLMSLARLERYEEQGELALEHTPILFILQSAIKACEEHALQKGIRLQLECDGFLFGEVNRNLLEEAVINLLDNAIKYSDRELWVTVSCRKQEQELAIVVTDQGIGIAAEHLPRLFERFYRVDKARSSNLGGTGLGLAIVKHIAQVHGGSVSVQSQPGKGSAFTIHLPLPASSQ
jgi:two-component system phosphate regulon sensor histidine kinase PhoR